MQFALMDGERVPAARGVSALCPQCRSRMIAKCGTLVAHHWAHEAMDCDPWWEPETAWHRQWKACVPAAQVEVTRAGHRADIVRRDGTVVELQHSPISTEDIDARERAYRRMVWLFDGRDIPNDRLILRPNLTYVSFRWKHPRKHYAYCRMPVYIDLGVHILRLKRMHLEGGPPYGGWGVVRPRADFLTWLVA